MYMFSSICSFFWMCYVYIMHVLCIYYVCVMHLVFIFDVYILAYCVYIMYIICV